MSFLGTVEKSAARFNHTLAVSHKFDMPLTFKFSAIQFEAKKLKNFFLLSVQRKQ